MFNEDEYKVVRYHNFYVLLKNGQPVYKAKSKGIEHKPMYEILGFLKRVYFEFLYETSSAG